MSSGAGQEVHHGVISLVRSLTAEQRNTFLASFLGWTLDGMDFFLISFVIAHIAQEFHKSVPTVTAAITLTVMMRPVGALIFGLLGDRYGRRLPLMIDILFYSLMELATAFSPTFTVFLILRGLYGIGMGGEWGLGTSLVVETLPKEGRGFFSGLLQEGYSLGYLLAAAVFALVYPSFGWRGMFVVGVLPALLVFFIREHVPESPVWLQRRAQNSQNWQEMRRALRRNWPLFLYCTALMTAFNFMSHGTQDLYPTFLEKQRNLGTTAVATVVIIYNLGAILGGMFFGQLSQRWGRRRSIILAAVLGAAMIPGWIAAPSTALLAVGAFLMQFMVQGAWGVIPAHLNELSPAALRGTFPALAYQMGNLFSAGAAQLEAQFATTYFATAADQPDYAHALALLALIVFAGVILVTAIGPERHGVDFFLEEQRNRSC